MKLNEFKKTVKESGQFNITNKSSDIDVTSYLKEDYVKSYPSFKKLAYSAFSLVIIAVLGVFGYLSYNPVTTLTIDINPSMEIKLNVFNRVVDIDTYNSESEEFVDNIDYKNKKLDYVLDEIYTEAIQESYFTDTEAYMLVGIYAKNTESEEDINTLINNLEDVNVISLININLDSYLTTYNIVNYQEAIIGSDNPVNGSLDDSYDSGPDDQTTQIVPNDSESIIDIYNLAIDYNVSQTKIVLVLQIIDYYDEYNYEEDFSTLINQEISELYLLYQEIN